MSVTFASFDHCARTPPPLLPACATAQVPRVQHQNPPPRVLLRQVIRRRQPHNPRADDDDVRPHPAKVAKIRRGQLTVAKLSIRWRAAEAAA